MNIVSEILVLLASTMISEQFYDYGISLPEEDRSLPPELKFLIVNKTDEEFQFEDCMNDYTVCMTFQRGEIVCASSTKTREKATFQTFCEMTYENCKSDEHLWEYFHDGVCVMELS